MVNTMSLNCIFSLLHTHRHTHARLSLTLIFLANCTISFFLNWSIVDLKCWVSFWCISEWFSYQFSSVQFSRSVVSDSLRPHEPQHARPPCPSPTTRVHPNSSPLSWWCHPTISSSVVPSPPALNLSQHQGLFQSVSSSHQVAKVLEFQLQHQSFQWTPRTDFL